MLNTLSLQDFAPDVGVELQVAGEPMQLVSATALRQTGPRVGEGRSGFSLLFRATAPTALGQGMHRVEHPRLGGLDLFLVPLGGQPAEFEAIFN